MPSLCLYFQVHQPFRLKPYDCFKIGSDHFYEDEDANKNIINRIADKCYLPANKVILDLVKKYKGAFKVSYAISGTALDQLEKYRTDVLMSFQDLAETNCVEFLSETYYHSLSFLFSKEEFIRQVGMHQQKIALLFGQSPTTFRNTELIYNNELAQFVHEMGYRGVLCEGVDKVLGTRSPNFLYHPPHSDQFKCLLKNYKLSDDIAFRFSDRQWDEFPLTAKKFAEWIQHEAARADTINLFMDYETFGEHQSREMGIFKFLKQLPAEILRHPGFSFKTPAEVIQTYPAKDEYSVSSPCSWADSERDVSAWLGNSLQQDAAERIYRLEQAIKATGNHRLIDTWAKLLTSDHLYYMCTKHWSDGDVHKYFSPYTTPYDAYINFMNVITDLEYVLENKEYTVAHPAEDFMNDIFQSDTLEPSIYL